MRERFRRDSCGESQPLILYVVYLQVRAVILAAFCRKKNKPSIKRAFTMFKRRKNQLRKNREYLQSLCFAIPVVWFGGLQKIVKLFSPSG